VASGARYVAERIVSGAAVGRHARIALLALALVLCGRLAGSVILAQDAAPPRESAHVDVERDLPPMRGDHLRAALVEVTYAPGASSSPHVHRCPVIGHVVSGALRTRAAGGVEHVYRAGESFQEDAGQAHLVSSNASDSVPVIFLAYFVCDGAGPRTVALTKEIPR
jgi:quercetin dioxygenase-like cupin family protein